MFLRTYLPPPPCNVINELLHDGGDDMDEDFYGQGAVAATDQGESPIKYCTWENVVTTTAVCNYVKGKKGDQTKLKGFRVSGETIPIGSVEVDDLRNWCKNKTEKSGRKDKKLALCGKIVEYKGIMETRASRGLPLDGSADGSSTNGSTDGGGRLFINKKRLADVIFSDTVKPTYARRGGSLDRTALQSCQQVWISCSFPGRNRRA
jgi:hypothetical protein